MMAAAPRHFVPLGLAMLLIALLLTTPLLYAPGANMEQMQQSTVRIICVTKGKSASTGSGFVVGTDRASYVVTNLHVVAPCAKPDEVLFFGIVLAPGNRVPIQIDWMSQSMDLAVVRAARPLGRPAVQFADTASVAPGALVTVVGFPGAADVMADTMGSEDFAVPSLTRGNISRIVTSETMGVRYFQHSAASNPGNSGGPVFDEAGNVIGVNSLKAMAVVATISGGQVSTDRISNGEGIAAAVDVAELMRHLKAQQVPYVMVSSLTPMNIAIFLVTAAVALLLAAGGIMVMTTTGREWLLRRAAPARAGHAASAQGGRIRILGGTLAGMDVAVSAKVVLGRDPAKAQIVFPGEDTAVSRQHCEIRFDSAAALFEVRDLGSRNGTFIANGTDAPRRLTPDVVARVAPGQNILVGSSRNRLVLELV